MKRCTAHFFLLTSCILAPLLPPSLQGQDTFGVLRSQVYQQTGAVSNPDFDMGGPIFLTSDKIATPFVKTYQTFPSLSVYDPENVWTPLSPNGDLWSASLSPASTMMMMSSNWGFDTNNDSTADAYFATTTYTPLPNANLPYLTAGPTQWQSGALRVNVLGNGYAFNWANNWAPSANDAIYFRILGMPAFDQHWYGSATQMVLNATDLSTFSLGQYYTIELEFVAGTYLGTESGGVFDGFSKMQKDSVITRIEMVAVPEPSTWALLLLGTGTAALVFWRRRRQTAAS